MAFRRAKQLDAAALENYALRLLGGRAMSSAELRQKLERRAERPADAEALLAKLSEYGYLDDKRFAEHYATLRKEREGFGRGRVLRDLNARKISRPLAEQAVRQAFEGADEDRLIEQFLARKYRRQLLGEILREPKGLTSAYRKLRYAGYGAAASIRVLKRYSALAEELEAMEDPGGEERGDCG